jgi:hypothetical protein
MLICSKRKVRLTDCWFVLREKYCWLVADKPNEHGEQEAMPKNHHRGHMHWLYYGRCVCVLGELIDWYAFVLCFCDNIVIY